MRMCVRAPLRAARHRRHACANSAARAVQGGSVGRAARGAGTRLPGGRAAVQRAPRSGLRAQRGARGAGQHRGRHRRALSTPARAQRRASRRAAQRTGIEQDQEEGAALCARPQFCRYGLRRAAHTLSHARTHTHTRCRLCRAPATRPPYHPTRARTQPRAQRATRISRSAPPFSRLIPPPPSASFLRSLRSPPVRRTAPAPGPPPR
jgi:hypothetical protein